MAGAIASEEAERRHTFGVEGVAHRVFIFTKCPVSVFIVCENTCLPVHSHVHKTHCALFSYHA